MSTVATFKPEVSFGFKIRRLRRAVGLTPRQLARIAGVTQAEVDLCEHDLPVRLDVRRRLLKELLAQRACLLAG